MSGHSKAARPTSSHGRLSASNSMFYMQGIIWICFLAAYLTCIHLTRYVFQLYIEAPIPSARLLHPTGFSRHLHPGTAAKLPYPSSLISVFEPSMEVNTHACLLLLSLVLVVVLDLFISFLASDFHNLIIIVSAHDNLVIIINGLASFLFWEPQSLHPVEPVPNTLY